MKLGQRIVNRLHDIFTDVYSLSAYYRAMDGLCFYLNDIESSPEHFL
jgi:hypothetical protein